MNHGHELPAIDGPREPRTYPDGCSVVPTADGGWLFSPGESVSRQVRDVPRRVPVGAPTPGQGAVTDSPVVPDGMKEPQ